MEVIFEILFQFAFEFVADLLAEAAVDGVGEALHTRRRRRIVLGVLGTVLGTALGFGGGWWWGDRLSDSGRVDPPRALYVSIGLASVFLVLAVVNAVRRVERERGGSRRDRLAATALPWRWTGLRLMAYALMNAAAAVGISVGFLPDRLG